MNKNSLGYRLWRLLGVLMIFAVFLGPIVIYFTGVKWWKYVIEIIVVLVLYYPYDRLDRRIRKNDK